MSFRAVVIALCSCVALSACGGHTSSSLPQTPIASQLRNAAPRTAETVSSSSAFTFVACPAGFSCTEGQAANLTGVLLTTAKDGNVWFSNQAQYGYINPQTLQSSVSTFKPISTIHYRNTTPWIYAMEPGPGAHEIRFIWQGNMGADGYGGVSTTRAPSLVVGGPFTCCVDSFVVSADGSIWAPAGNSLVHGANGTATVYPLPSGMAAQTAIVGPDGNIWVGASENATAYALKYNTSGVLLASYQLPGGSQYYLNSILNGPDGNIWISNPAMMLALTTSGTATWVSAPILKNWIPPVSGTDSVAIGPGGALYYVSRDSGGGYLNRIGEYGEFSQYRSGWLQTTYPAQPNAVTATSNGIWTSGAYNGSSWGFQIFNLHVISAQPQRIDLSPGGSTTITIAERGFSGTFNNFVNISVDPRFKPCANVSTTDNVHFTITAPNYPCRAQLQFIDGPDLGSYSAAVWVPVRVQ